MKNEHLIHIQFTPERSLQEQIREHLIENIRQGIFANNALPSCRKMASMLRVSRNTIVLVYDRLVDEGYLFSHERSGYYATEAASNLNELAAPPPQNNTEAYNAKPAQFWRARFKTDLESQRNIEKPRNWKQFPYPFLFGQPDHSLFPLAHWRECGRLAQRGSVIKDWISDSIDSDDPMLVKQLQANVLSKRGISAKPEEILITIGTQNSLYLLANLLADKQTTFGIEDPGYPDVRNIFAHHGAHIQTLPLDQQGLKISTKLASCNLIYTTPSHQVPTNVTMSMKRREKLLEFAEEKDLIIIEDDYDSEINLVSQPSPSLKSLDKNGRVVYVGSLSKTLSQGLRIGFMVADEALIEEARKLRRLMYRHPPANNQRTCALFISLGHYDTYLRKLRNSYKEKWTAMRQAIETYMPECITTETLGDSAFWLKLPKHYPAKEFAKRAQEIGVLVEPGDIHFHRYSIRSGNYIRMGYSAIDLNKIEPGIKKLSSLFGNI
ncbi:MocR-like pyridoxine biosynthesis transcription factor PdxR [Vibrio sp. WJH972]